MRIERLLRSAAPFSLLAAVALALTAGPGPWTAAPDAAQAKNQMIAQAKDQITAQMNGRFKVVNSGPVAISMRGPGDAVILQADGRALSLDTARGAVGGEVYRIPPAFSAIDVAAGASARGAVMCFSVNRQYAGERGSFVLQVFPDRKEVWAAMPADGVYVGIALDGSKGVAYVGNSSNNVVYRVRLGQEKGAVTEVATIAKAERIGAMAIDVAGQRLFVSDMGSGGLHVVALGQQPPGVQELPLPGVEEIRAVAWSPRDSRVYVADSGQEAVWSISVPPAARQVERFASDPAIKEPAGIAVADDGTLWLVDERGRAAFQLAREPLRVVRRVPWNAAPLSSRP